MLYRFAVEHSAESRWPRRGVVMNAESGSVKAVPLGKGRSAPRRKRSAGVGSIRLYAGKLDHLGPLLDFVSNELSEVGGRACKRCGAQICEPRLHFWIGEGGIDLLVEGIDDVRGRAFGHANAIPRTRLIARHEISHGWNIGQRYRTFRGGHRQCAQPAGAQV